MRFAGDQTCATRCGAGRCTLELSLYDGDQHGCARMIAGNAVMLKHASQTPLVGERLAQAFHSRWHADRCVPERLS